MSEPKSLIGLNDNQIRVLKLILSVDLDALGLEKKDQAIARSILKAIHA